MSRQKYPRHDSSRKLKQSDRGTPAQCCATGCQKPATTFTFIQFSYMRGEDEGVQHCDDHALSRGRAADPKEVSAWCGQFPPEAWK